MSQLDIFTGANQVSSTPQTPDPNAIRERLNAILQQLRAADRIPWNPAEVRSWRHVFHNMANWLPSDERDKLRQDFTVEIARLEQV